MIVTSDKTALIEMNSETSTGRPTPIKLFAGRLAGASFGSTTRPAKMNTSTGITIVPIAPSGSRRNIFSSTHVSFQSPCNIRFRLVANGATRQFQKNVFEVRKHGTEIRNANPILRQTSNHFGHQVVAAPADRDLLSAARYGFHLRQRAESFCRIRIV